MPLDRLEFAGPEDASGSGYESRGLQVDHTGWWCPGSGALSLIAVCGRTQDVDSQQIRGEVSMQCSTEGCTFHETHDLSAFLWPPRL